MGTGSKWWFWVHELVWWPVGILWICLAFYDATWLRDMYDGAVTLSFLGPFAGYWAALIWFMVQANNVKGWSDWRFWLTFTLYMGYTIWSMIAQVGMVPHVFDWIENAPINENYPEDDTAAQATADAQPADNLSTSFQF